MSIAPITIAEQFARFQAGQHDEETMFLSRYLLQLKKAVHSNLKTKIDQAAESVLQSVMECFEGGELDLQSRDSLWPSLFEIALRRCQTWNERVSLATPTPVEAVAPPKAPKEVVESIDLVAWLLNGFDNSDERMILILFLQNPHQAIERRVNMSERTTRETIQEARGRVNALLIEVRNGQTDQSTP